VCRVQSTISGVDVGQVSTATTDPAGLEGANTSIAKGENDAPSETVEQADSQAPKMTTAQKTAAASAARLPVRRFFF
jgi:hypothetical protein